MSVFILVEDSGCHCNDVINIGVYQNIEEAQVGAWLSILDRASKPWTLAFYEKRDDESAHACGIPDYIIEEWRFLDMSSKPVSKHYVGWIPGHPNVYWFDRLLKQEHLNVLNFISGLREDMIERKILPRIPQQLERA